MRKGVGSFLGKLGKILVEEGGVVEMQWAR